MDRVASNVFFSSSSSLSLSLSPSLSRAVHTAPAVGPPSPTVSPCAALALDPQPRRRGPRPTRVLRLCFRRLSAVLRLLPTRVLARTHRRTLTATRHPVPQSTSGSTPCSPNPTTVRIRYRAADPLAHHVVPRPVCHTPRPPVTRAANRGKQRETSVTSGAPAH